MWTFQTLSPIVLKEVENLPDDLQADLVRMSELIKSKGLERIGMPYVRHLKGPIWEIRLKGKSGIGRALYATVVGKRIVILRVFIKKTEKTPKRELELALNRWRALQT
jgi:phage-related protein